LADAPFVASGAGVASGLASMGRLVLPRALAGSPIAAVAGGAVAGAGDVSTAALRTIAAATGCDGLAADEAPLTGGGPPLSSALSPWVPSEVVVFGPGACVPGCGATGVRVFAAAATAAVAVMSAPFVPSAVGVAGSEAALFALPASLVVFAAGVVALFAFVVGLAPLVRSGVTFGPSVAFDV
jgi:hypothetical protein